MQWVENEIIQFAREEMLREMLVVVVEVVDLEWRMGGVERGLNSVVWRSLHELEVV
jgi:hypothetical protein